MVSLHQESCESQDRKEEEISNRLKPRNGETPYLLGLEIQMFFRDRNPQWSAALENICGGIALQI
jgi:hypothetical protein